MIFSLDLIPQNPNKEIKGIQAKMEDLAIRIAKIESYFQDAKSMSERIQTLERKYQDFADHKPVAWVSSVSVDENSGPLYPNPGPVLTFSATVNSGFFNFKNKNATAVRTSASRKSHIVAWGSTPLKKSGLQFFYYKIEGLNKGFQYINACIGIMTGNLYGKVSNLADHDGSGATSTG